MFKYSCYVVNIYALCTGKLLEYNINLVHICSILILVHFLLSVNKCMGMASLSPDVTTEAMACPVCKSDW